MVATLDASERNAKWKTHRLARHLVGVICCDSGAVTLTRFLGHWVL
jgi:hypothetical protein